MFSTILKNFLPFSTDLKLSSAISLCLEESKNLSFWERVNVTRRCDKNMSERSSDLCVAVFLLMTTQEAFVDSIYQDQIAQNVQSDLHCPYFHSRS